MYEDHVAANAASDAQSAVQSSFATEEMQTGFFTESSAERAAEPFAGRPAEGAAASGAAASRGAAAPWAAGQPSGTTAQATASAGVETTRAFSERLKAVSGRKVDEFIAGMGLQDHTGALIRTRAQYDAWQAARLAQPAGEQSGGLAAELPGTAADELRSLRGELRQLRDAERERTLLNDPEQGATYALLREKVQQLRGACAAGGADVSLDAVYAAVLLKELPGLYRTAEENARSQALRTVQANGQASPGALGGDAAPEVLDFETMSSEDFAEYRRRLMRGEWK